MECSFKVYRHLFVDIKGNMTLLVDADRIDVTTTGIIKILFYREGKVILSFPKNYVEKISYWPTFSPEPKELNID